MVDLIADWSLDRATELMKTGRRLAMADVRLLAPLAVRRNVIAVGRNYRDHAQEFSDSGFDASEKQVIPDNPIIFTKSPGSVIGPDEAIVLANDPDRHLGLRRRVGCGDRPGRQECLPRKDALSHVFGWTVVNDVTARDLQKRHVQWFIGKSPDTFCPMGPCITTIDELPDIRRSWLRTTVNGEPRQEAPISALIFDVETLIETLSEVMTLEPGDVIATGTGLGVGIGFTPPKYLAAGDVVEVSIDGIGTLRNPVV